MTEEEFLGRLWHLLEATATTATGVALTFLLLIILAVAGVVYTAVVRRKSYREHLQRRERMFKRQV